MSEAVRLWGLVITAFFGGAILGMLWGFYWTRKHMRADAEMKELQRIEGAFKTKVHPYDICECGHTRLAHSPGRSMKANGSTTTRWPCNECFKTSSVPQCADFRLMAKSEIGS